MQEEVLYKDIDYVIITIQMVVERKKWRTANKRVCGWRRSWKKIEAWL